MKALIKPWGYMGDHLFASGVAKKLKQDGFDVVDIACGVKQVEKLLNLNPYIDNVITTAEPTMTPLHGVHISGYDKEFELRETRKDIPPPLQFQMECGVTHPDSKFEIWTDPELDKKVKETYPEPYIAVMQLRSWTDKSYGFSVEDYKRGIDVPMKGYGGRLREVPRIVDELAEEFTLIEVGLIPEASTTVVSRTWGTGPDIFRSLSWDASVIKNAEFFIGAEGGLANVAAGVRTQTVLTGDFVHQLYGFNGVIRRKSNITGSGSPQLGPRFYWPEDGHVDLNPYLTDDEVIEEMTELFRGNKSCKEYTYEWESMDYEKV